MEVVVQRRFYLNSLLPVKWQWQKGSLAEAYIFQIFVLRFLFIGECSGRMVQRKKGSFVIKLIHFVPL